MKKIFKGRVIAWVLTLALVFSLVPTSAFAADDAQTPEQTVSTVAAQMINKAKSVETTTEVVAANMPEAQAENEPVALSITPDVKLGSLPAEYEGTFASKGQTICFQFTASEGQIVAVVGGGVIYDLSHYSFNIVKMTNANENAISSVTANGDLNNIYKIPETGTYYVTIRAQKTGAYALRIADISAAVSASDVEAMKKHGFGDNDIFVLFKALETVNTDMEKYNNIAPGYEISFQGDVSKQNEYLEMFYKYADPLSFAANLYHTVFFGSGQFYFWCSSGKNDTSSTYESRKAQLQEVANHAKEYISSATTDFGKAFMLYRFCEMHITYSKNASLCDSAYGALINGQAKCDGYASAYLMLLRLAGVESMLVKGRVSASGIAHGWNLVKVDGQWYNADTTWAASPNNGKYFLLSDAEIKKERTIDADQAIGLATSTKYDNIAWKTIEEGSRQFFFRNKLYVTNVNTKRLTEYNQDGSNPVVIHDTMVMAWAVTFTNGKVYFVDINKKLYCYDPNTETKTELATVSVNDIYELKLCCHNNKLYDCRDCLTNGTPIYDLNSAQAPAAPTNVKATAAGSDKITLSWSVSTGATRYYIYRATSEGGTYKQVSNVSTAAFTDSGLTASTTYYYKVRAYSTAGYSSDSVVVSATTNSAAKDTYAVKYDANGGKNAPAEQTKTQGVTLELSSVKPTRDGYTFLGWATSASATTAQYQPGASYTAEGEATLYAVWKMNPVSNIAIDTEGRDYLVMRGAWANEFTKTLKVLDANGTQIPNRDIAWSIVSGSAQKYSFSANCVVVNSGTLTAQCSGICEVQASYNGMTATAVVVVPGDCTRDGLVNEADFTYLQEVILGIRTNPTVYDQALMDLSLDDRLSVIDSLRIYQLANKIAFIVEMTTYTVSYDANGGTGAPASQEKASGTTLELSSVKPTRDGYTFLGWATSASATTAQYQPGASYTAEGEATLYAVWTKAFALAVPTNLTAKAKGNDTVWLDWTTTISGSPGFEVFRSSSLNGEYERIKTVTTKSYIDVGLKGGTTYYYKVRAFQSGEYSDFTNAISVKTSMIPNAPTSVSAKGKVGCKVSVSWNASTGATGYYILRSMSSAGPFEKVGTTTALSFEQSGLTAGTSYYYQVQAYNSYGVSDASSACGLVAANALPGTPSKIAAVSNNDGTVTVNWTPSAEAETYMIVRSTERYTPYYSYAGLTKNTTFVDKKNLTTGTTYYYKVYAINSIGESEKSWEEYVTISSQMPQAVPTNVSAECLTPDKNRISWTASPGAENYDVYRSSDSYNYELVGSSNSSVPSLIDGDGVQPNTTYFYFVIAYSDEKGGSLISETVKLSTAA